MDTADTPTVAYDAEETARSVAWSECAERTVLRVIDELCDLPDNEVFMPVQMLNILLDRLEPGGGPLPARTALQVAAEWRREWGV